MLRRTAFGSLLGIGLFISVAALLLIVTPAVQGARLTPHLHNIPRLAPTAVPGGGSLLPDDATPLELDKPLTESLDDKIVYRYYKFNGKIGEIYKITLSAVSGNFRTNIIITSPNSDYVLGTAEGDTLIDSTMRVVIPVDNTYGVIIEYFPATIGTPVPGNISVTLSKVAATK